MPRYGSGVSVVALMMIQPSSHPAIQRGQKLCEETDAAVGVRPRARFADHKEFTTDTALEEAG